MKEFENDVEIDLPETDICELNLQVIGENAILQNSFFNICKDMLLCYPSILYAILKPNC